MEEEYSSLELNEDIGENEDICGNEDIGENEDICGNEAISKNEMDATTNAKEKIEDPKIGMMFDSVDEIHKYYVDYAKENGFAVVKKSFKKDGDGVIKYLTIACTHAGNPRKRSSNPVNSRPQTKMGCKAGINVVRSNEKYKLTSCELEHNHILSPTKARFFKCNRVLPPNIKRRLEINDSAGIRVNKSFDSFVVEAGGHENVPFQERDVRNFVDNFRRMKLRLGKGDAEAMLEYFMRMQDDNSDFFYAMDLNENSRLRNVFWADARSRAAYQEFGDVVTFDTTYLVNRYDMPFAPFVGMNHHGNSTLLGCALISHKDTETFTWLFGTWLRCMSGRPPTAILTDQDKAMKNAIQIVFPHARHRRCLWHIMKKLPEKLRGCNQYESIKFDMQNSIYDSLTKEEFEENWSGFIQKHKLESNDWLCGLFKERHRWVPVFVKDIFWAGMSSAQRSEQMNAFFDKYINTKTNLKQFVEQYENALAKKVENETNEDFNSGNSFFQYVTDWEFERQFQQEYTCNKFKEFQDEIVGKIKCYLSTQYDFIDGFVVYDVQEDVKIQEQHRRVSFNVYFHEAGNESNCTCRLFEFKGIVCRHQIMVYLQRKIYKIPDKYILRRWRKNVRRSHSKVRISYDKSANVEALNYNKMCNAFQEVADMAAPYFAMVDKVMMRVHKLKEELKQDTIVCESNSIAGIGSHSTTVVNGMVISKENINVVDPVPPIRKGRPRENRWKPISEAKIKKSAEAKAKKNKKKNSKALNEVGNVHDEIATAYVGLGTQESINLNELSYGQSEQVYGLPPQCEQQNMFWRNIPISCTEMLKQMMPNMNNDGGSGSEN